MTDPLARLATWIEEARAAGVRMPEAATLSTVTLAGTPAARTVSVKRVDERGLLFGTPLTSRKGDELQARPHAALTFWWELVGRQVRVEGDVEPVARDEVQVLWDERGRANRLVTVVSQQGQPLSSRQALEEAFTRASERFGDGPIPCPHDWGAFRVVPATVEFWREDEGRLIERELFVRGAARQWESTLLQP